MYMRSGRGGERRGCGHTCSDPREWSAGQYRREPAGSAEEYCLKPGGPG